VHVYISVEVRLAEHTFDRRTTALEPLSLKGLMKRTMRFHTSILLFLLSIAATLFAQRLPQIATPENYRLTFTPDFTTNKFGGNEIIQIRVLKPTRQIALNALEIDFRKATISSSGVVQLATIATDKDKEMATLSFDQTITPGPATINITYNGILNDELRGFYLGKEENGTKYAVTQFESTDARRAFPSFDEPVYKATFDVTVITDKDLTVLSNRNVVSDTPGPDAGKHTVTFATTAKMSSYLLAIAVGDFEYIEGSADGIPIRVYTFPGKKDLTHFALEAAEHSITYYDKYFGVKYPFGKLDMVGLPDFAAGAMENAGLITYREVALLADPKTASIDQLKMVGVDVAHEIAHQWFGDLVTMQWWDDIWLNEGFATWMSSKPLEEWKPQWRMDLDDALETTQTLNTDSLSNTRPIHQAAETSAQIQELFDGIAYGKAASVLRMLEAYLGPETFRKGVDSYIRQHAYGNATAGDFWSALTVASHKPVDQIMPTFVNQAGAPLVSMETQCISGATTVKLSQQRYFYDRDKFNAGNDELWQIPVCMKIGSAESKTENKCELITAKQSEVKFPGCATWGLANASATGYYRSGYSSEDIAGLAGKMQSELTPAERIRLLSDEWAMVRVGRQSAGDYLALASGLQSETSGAVMQEAIGQIRGIGDYLVSDSDRPAFEQWVRTTFTPLAQQLGWQPAPGESEDRKALRDQVITGLGYSGHDPQVLAEAAKLTQEMLNGKTLDPSIRETAFILTVMNGDEALYTQILDHIKDAKTPEDFYLYAHALSQFRDPKLLGQTLQATLSPRVRSQDAPFAMAAVIRNPAGRQIGWDFVQANWAQIDKMTSGFNAGAIISATGSFCDASSRDQVKSFFAEHPVPYAARALKQSVERIDECIDLRSQQSAQLASWLGRHEGTSLGTH